MEQHYELGEYIRKRYGKFLNESYKHQQASWGAQSGNLVPLKEVNIMLHLSKHFACFPKNLDKSGILFRNVLLFIEIVCSKKIMKKSKFKILWTSMVKT